MRGCGTGCGRGVCGAAARLAAAHEVLQCHSCHVHLCCVFIAELVDIKCLRDGQWEALQRLGERDSADAAVRIAELPEIPEPVDHGVVCPEDGIVGRERHDAHRS